MESKYYAYVFSIFLNYFQHTIIDFKLHFQTFQHKDL